MRTVGPAYHGEGAIMTVSEDNPSPVDVASYIDQQPVGGFSLGAALGGLLAAALIPQFGWRSVFVAGGAAPLLLVPILALRLPESVRFLALTGQANERVAQLLALISPKAVFAPATQFVVHEPGLAGIPVLHLFREG